MDIESLNIINCDANPYTPSGWKVEEHKKGGQLVLDLSKVKLHLSPNQQGGKVIEGNKLRKELASEPVLNANVLDYLLAHPKLIPEEWKGEKGNIRYIFFWGTIYRNLFGDPCVRFLYRRDGAWRRSDTSLGHDWDGDSPAAVLAS